MAGSTIAKIIVVAAFLMFTHVIYTVVTFLLGFMLPQVLETAGSWSEILRKGAVGATILVAARASFGVCRRMWPTPRLQA